MTVIYVRHGDDGNSNPSYLNDPSLTEESRSSIKKLTRRLLQKFGRPDAIYVSPMRRTWETALIMGEFLNRSIPLFIDPHLSRYFTQQEKDSKTVRPDTLDRKVPILESKYEFRSRVDRHIKHIISCYSSHGPVVWCITHALVMKRLGKTFHRPINRHIHFLETFILDETSFKKL